MNNSHYITSFNNADDLKPCENNYYPSSYINYSQTVSADAYAHVLQQQDASNKHYEFFSYYQQSLIQDQNWINSWLVKKNLTEKPAKSSEEFIKINVAQDSLKKCLSILKQLKISEAMLKANINNLSNLSWEQKLMEIDKQKALLLSLLSPFDSSTILNKLQRDIKKRRSYRTLMKFKKIERHNQLTNMYNRRQQLHKSIDQWLEEQKDQVERVKREEYLKREADCVLSEVTKKKTDARRQLTLLTSLIKLRSVREKAADARGEKISLEDRNTFITITERLKNMWQKALKTYGIEEQGLKLMLESKSDKSETKDDKNKKIIKEWELTLFGPKYVPNEAYWVLTCAEKDLETFIALRKSWDTFLTSPNSTHGTSIPIGWILPQTPSSPGWRKYLDN